MGRGVPPRPPKPSDPVIGLPVKATPNQELPSIYIEKKDKMADETPTRLCVSQSPFNGADFCREGTRKSISKKTKLWRGVIGRRVYLR